MAGADNSVEHRFRIYLSSLAAVGTRNRFQPESTASQPTPIDESQVHNN